MTRNQAILRVTKEDYHNLLESFAFRMGCPASVTVVSVITNPYNASVDILLDDESYPEVKEFEVPVVLGTGGTALPKDWAM